MARIWPYVFVFLAAVIWGTLGPIGAHLNTLGYGGREVASLRIAFSALLLVGAFPFMSRGLRPYSGSACLVLAHALVGVVGYNISYFVAISRIGVTLSVGLLYTSPLWTVIGSAVLLGVALTAKQIGLAMVSIAGVLMVLSPIFGQEHLQFDIVGIVEALISAICYALYGVLGKRCLDKGLIPTDILFSSFLIAGMGNLVSPDLWTGLSHLANNLTLTTFLLLFGISWIGTVMSYLFFTHGLKTISATSVSLITPIEPVTAVIVATLFLHEPLNLAQLVGFSLIIGSALLGTIITSTKQKGSKFSKVVELNE